ncbi:MAG: hypothetical protein ABSH09_17110 [Bryobacteraceae bacterium]|jgi:hypothetical protein
MSQKLWLAAIALSAFTTLTAQEPPPLPSGNSEIVKMLSAGVPESTILSQVELLAERGSSFDVSPSAIVELQRRGASEKIMNEVIWAQATIVPTIDIPVPRGVFYRSGTAATPLNSFLLWPEVSRRWTTWPFFGPADKHVALSASPGVVQVSDSTPTLVVQGFGGDEDWQLVHIKRGSDYREVHVKTHGMFSNDFFSDSVFDRNDLRPVAFAPAGAKSFTVRPTAALEAGDYALCGGLPEGGWMRACYEFHIGSAVQ